MIQAAFFVAVIVGGLGFFTYQRIKRRGPKRKYLVEHQAPGYRGWMDDDPMPSPRYGIILRVLGGIIALAIICGGVSGYLIAGNPGDDALPTRVALEETIELIPEFTEEAHEQAEQTAENTPTETSSFEVSTSERVYIQPTYTPYDTYTPYPTLTPHVVIVTEIIENERVIHLTSPPQYIPVTVVVNGGNPQPAPIIIPTSQPSTHTPTQIIPTVTPSPTEILSVCLPTATPQMFMSPTPQDYVPTLCVTWTPSETLTPTSTLTSTLLPTATLTPLPTATPLLLTATPTLLPTATPLLPTVTPTLLPTVTEETTNGA